MTKGLLLALMCRLQLLYWISLQPWNDVVVHKPEREGFLCVITISRRFSQHRL